MNKNAELEDTNLLCPECGEAYSLHHFQIEIFVRNGEDGDGTKVTVGVAGDLDGWEEKTSEASKAIALMQPVASKDIPGRRDALYILFFCEHCAGTKKLRIMQHKGSTLVEWIGLAETEE